MAMKVPYGPVGSLVQTEKFHISAASCVLATAAYEYFIKKQNIP
jgi:hypothetical protein